MSKRTRSVTQLTRILAAFSLCASSLAIVNACSSDPKSSAAVVGENGRLRLELTGISTTDQVYRLRNGAFTITGRATGLVSYVNTETEPDRPSMLVELPPDTYDVFLEAGFVLEKLPGGLPVAARRELATRGGRSEAIKPRARLARAADAGVAGPSVPAEPGPPAEPAAAGVVVDAQLISSNPGVATIAPNVVSPLAFVFRVRGDTVETGSGVLDIGLTIIDDDAACINDGFEPNEDLSTATPIVPGVQVDATLCLLDTDTYVFPAPVAAGEPFAVTVGFQTALGDIDAILESVTTGALVFGAGVSDNEVLFTTSDGGDYILQTFLFNGGPSGNSYTVDVGPFDLTATNQCCEPSPTPGCNDPAVLECVCEADSFCCQGSFDEVCVALAFACGTSCVISGAESDCCTTSDAPGCTNVAVSSCICATDSQCCFGSFDALCVAQAISECGAQCTLPEPESDCCTASAVPGCTVDGVSACVCGIDPYCCSGAFDENCAALAESQCDAVCQP